MRGYESDQNIVVYIYINIYTNIPSSDDVSACVEDNRRSAVEALLVVLEFCFYREIDISVITRICIYIASIVIQDWHVSSTEILSP